MKIKNEWILKNDNLPKISKEKIDEGYCKKQVLVYTNSEPKVKMAWFDIEDENFYDDDDFLSGIIYNVIAWHEIPGL